MNALRIASAALVFISVAAAQSSTLPESSSYPLAVWYGGGKARAPMLERLDPTSAGRWGKDLDSIKSLGFTTIKCWVDWATAEPHRGDFSFANLDLLLHLAEQRGMRIIVQIYLDSAPRWVGQLYPDGRFVDRSGAVIVSQAAPGYCIDHNGVRREIVNFLQALSRDANRSPALYGWDVWSEPHIVNWADFPYLVNPEFCFCPYTQARFRDWLKAKYKTLAALNAAWYREFADWSEVQPPRYPTILSYTDYLDWRAFIDDKLAGDLKTRVDAIRTADETHPITSHAAAPGLFTSPTDGFGEPDDFKMSANADFFGTSLYPKHSQSTHPWSRAMLDAGLDFSRSAGHSLNKGFWIGELQAGQGATGMRIAEPVTPHDEEFWIWQAIAHGAREIAIYAWYPMSSGFESNGYGLINLDGSVTDRARAAGKIAQIVNHHASELLDAKPDRAEVAILYNRLSYMVGGSQSSLSKLGNAERDSLMGLHRAFAEENIPVDFVDAAEVAENHLGQYKIVFLPFPVMLSRDVAQGVEHYVESGGTTLAEARLAWNDARGFASDTIPGFGLDRVFGAKEKLIRPSDHPRIAIDASSALAGAAFEEDLEPLPDARVLARFEDGAPAVVENAWGKGKAILAGSFLALAYQRTSNDSIKQFFLSLARSVGVAAPVTVTQPPTPQIEIRRLVGNRHQVVFVFNYASKPVDAKFSLNMPWQVSEVRNLADDTPVPFQTESGNIAIHKHLAQNEICVFRIQAR